MIIRPIPVFKENKQLRPYQANAITNVVNGLAEADRGKLIMACGTGKTFTALRLSEQMSGLGGKGGRILFLVPSLNLLSQTLTEWTQESSIPLHCYAVCSDSEIGKKRNKSEDDFELLAHELQYPATTNAKQLAKAFSEREGNLCGIACDQHVGGLTRRACSRSRNTLANHRNSR